jgi:DNA-binding transcriptional LysR family regulator
MDEVSLRHRESHSWALGRAAVFQFAEKDLRLLKVFMTVVDSGGYTAAQAELNVGTSTISNHMTELEQRLGARLCQRGRIGFQLTDKGEFVYQAA